jgi:hypothetical protein
MRLELARVRLCRVCLCMTSGSTHDVHAAPAREHCVANLHLGGESRRHAQGPCTNNTQR